MLVLVEVVFSRKGLTQSRMFVVVDGAAGLGVSCFLIRICWRVGREAGQTCQSPWSPHTQQSEILISVMLGAGVAISFRLQSAMPSTWLGPDGIFLRETVSVQSARSRPRMVWQRQTSGRWAQCG